MKTSLLLVLLSLGLSTFGQTSLINNGSSRLILSNGNLTARANPYGQAIATIDDTTTIGGVFYSFIVDSLGVGSNRRASIGVGINGMNFDGQLDAQSLTWCFDECPNCLKGDHLKAHLNASNTSVFGQQVFEGDTISLYVNLNYGFIYLQINSNVFGNPSSGSLGTGAMWSFTTGQTNYYFVGMVNRAQGSVRSSQITLLSPAISSQYPTLYKNL